MGSSRLETHGWDRTTSGRLCQHSQGAPRAWDTFSANDLTSFMDMEQSRYDCCLFYHLEPRREHIEKKAGRHIDDFLVTGPEPNVERFLAQVRDKLNNMQDAVRLHKAGDEGTLLAMNLRKLENGFSLRGKPFLIHGIATALGMENAKASFIPETINERKHRTATVNHSHHM